MGLKKPPPGLPRSRFRIYLIILLFVLGLGIYAGEGVYSEQRLGHVGLRQHWHARLRIVISGRESGIPGFVAVTTSSHVSGGRRGSTVVRDITSGPLHTHGDDGVIHIESKVPGNYTLGEFFKAWGMTFNSTCILESCNDSSHAVRMLVDGVPNAEFERLILKDGQNIVIEYK